MDKEGYLFIHSQFLKLGTRIFSLGTEYENYKVYETEVTDKFQVDDFGYLCVLLKGIDVNVNIWARIELLVCSIHTRSNDFLIKEEAKQEREKRLNKLYLTI